MGDPRKLRNKFERPKKLWDVDRLAEEKRLKTDFGLKNMRELWRATAELKKYRREARRLLSVSEEERRDDAKKILVKLAKMGILKEGSPLDDVLSLEVKDVLERRLQTVVLRKGLAKSMAQSRQLITHGFIMVDGSRVTKPAYLVRTDENLAYSRPIEISSKPPAEEKPESKEAVKSAESNDAPAPAA